MLNLNLQEVIIIEAKLKLITSEEKLAEEGAKRLLLSSFGTSFLAVLVNMPKRHASQHETSRINMLNPAAKPSQTEPKTTTETKTEHKKQTEKERNEPKNFSTLR